MEQSKSVTISEGTKSYKTPGLTVIKLETLKAMYYQDMICSGGNLSTKII